MTKIAIPQLDDMVAPRFEAARKFLIISAIGRKITSSQTITCDGPEAYRRIRMLQIHRVTILVCNGIKSSYSDMLVALGLTVIPKISGKVKDVLKMYLEDELTSEEGYADDAGEICSVSHETLVERARELFEAHGYQVTSGPGSDSFLIDLIAEISCFKCNQPVKVAICCGAHTYRADQEIIEFHHATSSGYNARVYICSPKPSIERCCHEYGIELVDFDQANKIDPKLAQNGIPLLKGVVKGHEQASPDAINK